ncbi:universal stress protein [Aliiroseovarius sp. CAU 1755]
MFNRIMVPVDLAHADKLEKSLTCAAKLAAQYGIEVCYVGVTAETPSPLGHNPKEYDEKLAAFAAEQSAKHGHAAVHKSMLSHDVVTDVDDALIEAVKETGADLVVMATHAPGLLDVIWPSNGTKLAAHTKASVFLVR